jgi:sulfite reductase beta subunit-like hemoprotein
MSCPDAGVGLEEPFDCSPDARAVQDLILARTPKLNTQLPSRMNIHFGGCAACREHAKLNEAGFVSVIRDGVLGYELWVGGSLGKSAPMLSFKAIDFLPREDVLPAIDALFDVYIEHGNFEQPAKARMKFLISSIGEEAFTSLFLGAFDKARAQQSWPEPQPVTPPLSSALAEILARSPDGGWSSGVRPQRIPGWAMVTVNVPIGELYADDARTLAAIAADFGDGNLHFTRNQNAMVRWVSVGNVPAVRERLASVGLSLQGADQALDVRVCTAGPVCSLAITAAASLGPPLLDHAALARNSGLRVSVSGCPNACAQHQIADIGLSGGRVTITGVSMLGYQIWLGADVRKGRIGEVVGRVAEADVPAIIDAIVGAWEALRFAGETLSEAVDRVGVEGFQTMIAAVFEGRWAPGPEPPALIDLRVRSVVGGRA